MSKKNKGNNTQKKIVNNNVKSVLNEFAISQIDLADTSGLSISTISRASRRVGKLKADTQKAITDGINTLLLDGKNTKKYTVDDIFDPNNFGKI